MPIKSIYQMVLTSSLADVTAVNTFFYRDINDNAPTLALAIDLNDAFYQDIVTAIDGFGLDGSLFCDDVSYDNLYTINLGEPSVIRDIPLTATGANLTECLPPFVAYGFRTNRPTREIRRGMKRFMGVPEENSNAGVIPTTILTNLAILAGKMAGTIARSASPTTTWEPVIVKRVKEVDVFGKPSYRLPNTDEELVFFDVGAWSPYNVTRSQASRQRSTI